MFQHIIFDLDGTLWNTSESYLFAYQKLCEEYSPSYRQTDEQILSYLGVPLLEVISHLKEFSAPIEELASKALLYSIEYNMKHPTLTSSHLDAMFSSLSKTYKIAIISNCPKAYLEAFFELTQLKKFVDSHYTLEDGTKEAHLYKITHGYQEKAIFIGDSYSDYLVIQDHKKVVFCYASYGYKDAREYDFKLTSLDMLEDLLEEITTKDSMLGSTPYEVISVYDSNCTILYKEDVCYFGFMHTSHNENDSLLIEKLKSIGKNILGPINGNTWYPYRISLTEFDFKLYPDCLNDQILLNQFFAAGFGIESKYTSTLARINEDIWERGRRVVLDSSYRIEIVHHEACYAYLDALYDVASIAFVDASYYEPISREAFKKLYMKNMLFCQPDLVLAFHQEKVVAFNFCYEDLEKRFYVCKTIGILPEHRSMKMILKLIDASYQMMVEYGYKEVLYHFQNDQTKTLYPIFKNHRIKQKQYGLLRYPYEK